MGFYTYLYVIVLIWFTGRYYINVPTFNVKTHGGFHNGRRWLISCFVTVGVWSSVNILPSHWRIVVKWSIILLKNFLFYCMVQYIVGLEKMFDMNMTLTQHHKDVDLILNECFVCILFFGYFPSFVCCHLGVKLSFWNIFIFLGSIFVWVRILCLADLVISAHPDSVLLQHQSDMERGKMPNYWDKLRDTLHDFNPSTLMKLLACSVSLNDLS